MQCECPKCKEEILTEHDKVSIQYGKEGFSGKLFIEFCPECGYVFSRGTWAE